jgi:nucleoside-diphosphate-sugar epimerase
MNVYARSKVDAEKLVEASRDEAGIRASIVRFSNVYGSLSDHRDRVIPAFARLASEGGVLSVEGSETTLDFTHVEDVVTGLMRMIEIMSSGDILPTIHLVSGQGTTLNELAMMAVKIARKGTIEINSARLFDVNSFIGDTARAVQLLDWRASTPIREGFGRLITLFLPADT